MIFAQVTVITIVKLLSFVLASCTCFVCLHDEMLVYPCKRIRSCNSHNYSYSQLLVCITTCTCSFTYIIIWNKQQQARAHIARFLRSLSSYSQLLYIANRSSQKSFAVAELNFNSLEKICGWMVVLHGKAYCTGHFTGKVLRYRSICENRETFPP